ncbi:hypothetical protein BKA62DRAFT_797838 [Auriculariales sp. MPI-PUGE-AT-0066]|nr:hypothetical protein BKA62DRAFT_797838 [Auriculariales sp. MPI-PUGE-AT-0066]
MPSITSNLSHKPCMTSLPVEILIPVFQNFSDLQTLHAAILACKLFHDVFNGHQPAICRAVIVNRLGNEDVLVPALRELRTAMYYRGELPPTFEATLGGISERSVAAGVLEPTRMETKLLFGRAEVLDVLELYFSRSRKDRQTLTTSRLEPHESARFKIAMLRVWVLHHAFKHMDVDARQRNWFSQDDEPFIARKTAIYDEFSVEKLSDIGTVIVWAGTYAQHLLPLLRPFHMNWHLVEHGPTIYAQRCLAVDRERQISINRRTSTMEPGKQFWDYDTQKIWRERGVEHDDTEGIFAAPIGVRPLVEPLGADDTCAECHVEMDCGLWNESNWKYLAGYSRFWSRDPLYEMRLTGRLCVNDSERTLIRMYIDNPTRTDLGTVTTDQHDDSLFNTCPYGIQGEPEVPGGPISIPRILRELFELPTQVTEPTLKAYMQYQYPYVFKNNISPRDWLCYWCLNIIVVGRFWIWWYHQRASGKVLGRPLLEKNCQAGFDCDRQHEQDHITVENAEIY